MNENTVTVDELESDDRSAWPPNDDTFSKDDLLDGILNRCADIEAVGEEAVEIAIDATLQYVVDWLHERGNVGPAAVLESIGEVG